MTNQEVMGMAEVLTEHLNLVGPLRHIFRNEPVNAGELIDALEVLLEQEVSHVADALADAGFGHVASVECEAKANEGALAEAHVRILARMRARAEAAEARLAAVRALLNGAPMVPQAQVRNALNWQAVDEGQYG